MRTVSLRTFGTFIEDLQSLACWLMRRQVRSVALESRGMRWLLLVQIKGARGLEVCSPSLASLVPSPPLSGQYATRAERAGRKLDVHNRHWL